MKKTYEFAEIAVEVSFTSLYVEQMCRSYESDRKPDVSLTISQQDIENERLQNDDGTDYPWGYLESLALYRRLATVLLSYNVLLFHGSAVALDGEGYIFTAPSGTGKSTHAALCMRVYENRCDYINDDKPLLRLKDGQWYVYGTPWDGKHHLSRNIGVPLRGICFIKQAKNNFIEKTNAGAAFPDLFTQIFCPKQASDVHVLLPLAVLLSELPLWKLRCNISTEAAELSLSTMAKCKGEPDGTH